MAHEKKSALAIALAVIGVFTAAIVGLVIVAAIYVYNTKIWAVETEQVIMTKYESNQNTKSAMTNKVLEMMGVTDAYRDDLYSVIERTFEGRYGEDGSRGVFQFIQENNLALDAELYKTVQRAIEAGRLEFKQAQDMLLDQVRIYKTHQGYPIKGFVLTMLGYPSNEYINMKIGIIIDSTTRQQFETKIDEPLKLR